MLYYIIFFLSLFLIDKSLLSYKNKLIIAGIWISLFSGFRYGIGYDYFMYYEFIEKLTIEREMIPMLFMEIAHYTHYSFFFIASSFFITFFFISGIISKNLPFSTIYFYIGFPLFFFASFSIIRQSMAYAVIFFLMCNFNKFNYKKKILFIIIAFLCHRSSLIALILLIPTSIYSQKLLFTMFIGSIIGTEFILKKILAINSEIGLIMQLQGFIEVEYQGGGFKKLIVYGITFTLLLFYNRICKRNDLQNYVIWSIIGGCLYALFSFSGHIAERFCTFFFTSTLILIIPILKMFKINKLIYVTCCIMLFSLSTYTGHKTSVADGQWIEYRNSLYYPYMTIFELW